MDWLKKNYDRVILILVGLLMLAIGAWLYLNAASFSEQFTDRNSSKPANHTVAPAALEPIEQGAEAFAKPRNWGGHEGSLFISRPYVLKDGHLFDPLESEQPLHPPVENKWLIKYDLDYTLVDVLNTDPDKDGFTVLEEWNAKTDPTDPNSIPPYWTKLRLKQVIRIPFRVKFSGTPDGGETFTINSIDDPKQRTQFLKIGDTISIAGVPYTLSKYEAKTQMVNEISKDISELSLENKTTGETIVLIYDKVIDSPTSYAIFVNELDGSELKVKNKTEFTLPQEPDAKYKLIDIKEENATIEGLKSGDKYTVPSLNSVKP